MCAPRISQTAYTLPSPTFGRLGLFQPAAEPTDRRDEILASVSHDLMNPLGTITTATAFILDELSPVGSINPATRNYVEIIARAAARMRILVGDLQDTTAIEAGRLRIALRPEPIGAVLDEARDMLRPLAAAKGVSLAVISGPLDAELYADRERLLQVFANIGGNAIKFTPCGGVITLTAIAGEDSCVFGISDTGPGISPDDLPYVFDRFWQAEKTARSGFGLGLAIAKGIVEAHFGQLHVSSVLGQGCTFKFSVPSAAAHHQ